MKRHFEEDESENQHPPKLSEQGARTMEYLLLIHEPKLNEQGAHTMEYLLLFHACEFEFETLPYFPNDDNERRGGVSVSMNPRNKL